MEPSVAHRVLIVDDDPSNHAALDRILSREGYAVLHASSGREAMELFRENDVDLVLTDLKMPGMTGLDLLKAIRTVREDVEVVVMTAYGTVETAVEAMKDGAYDFVTKPLSRLELVTCLRKALERRSLHRENASLKAELERSGQAAVVGRSPAMRALLAEVDQVAPSDATVLLSGESGTGKGHVARLLHRLSRRHTHKMLTVNCAALPEQLLESELFGYERGAFTGATQRKEGRFDLARGGTLFLDEITEMNPATQVKLLRVLQEGEYERVGGTETIEADVRVIAASNRNIEEEVDTGRFRKDLFYRLNVIRLHIPALRDRDDDVSLLAQHFLERYATKNGKRLRGFTAEALDALDAWSWPGNVRELENAIERAVVLSRDATIGLYDLPPAVRGGEGKKRLTFEVGTPLKHVERRMIEETLVQTGGDKTLAATLLGITARTIYRREAEWALESEQGAAAVADDDG
jgi:two-component system response regulator HydG